jgi:hypothetical protein
MDFKGKQVIKMGHQAQTTSNQCLGLDWVRPVIANIETISGGNARVRRSIFQLPLYRTQNLLGVLAHSPKFVQGLRETTEVSCHFRSSRIDLFEALLEAR